MDEPASIEERAVQYGNTRLHYDLVRTDRRTLGFVVHPDTRVELRAPLQADAAEVDRRVLRKAAWILRQQRQFRSFLSVQPPKDYVSGETHRYLGKQYRLKVHPTAGASTVKLIGGRLHVHARHPRDPEHVAGLLAAWYRAKARIRFAQAVDKAVAVLTKHGVEQPVLEIRRMARRWGSCTPGGRILLNPELIQKPGPCIDYVAMHELCHLVHPDHSRAFYALLDRSMPDWKKWKAKLEEAE